MIAGLLLAAGRGARFGGDKLLAELAGRPVIHWSAATVGAEVDALYVVVPAGDVARRAAVASLAAVIVEHPRPGGRFTRHSVARAAVRARAHC